MLKKFQLAHFIAIQNKSFNFYEHLSEFEKNVHKVDLGNGYLTDKAGREITVYLSNSVLMFLVFKSNIILNELGDII